MKNFIVIFIVSVLFVSCAKKNPIVFQKETETEKVTITLDTNGSFRYEANSPIGAAFNEEGTYVISDSLLVLQFKYESFEHLCYTIPLTNDTSIIANVGTTVFLFPAMTEIEELDFHRTDEDILSELNKVKTNPQAREMIGSRYFKKVSGDLSLICK